MNVKDKALGIIETVGLIPGVECADTALKTADVELIGCRYAGAGLVAVHLAGDVSSVKAAVEGGRAAGARIGEVKWHTVIARIAQGLDTVIGAEDSDSEGTDARESPGQDQAAQTEESGASPPAEDNHGTSRDALEKMSVARLKTMARQIDGFSLTREQIRKSRKKELIEAIDRFCGKEEKDSWQIRI